MRTQPFVARTEEPQELSKSVHCCLQQPRGYTSVMSRGAPKDHSIRLWRRKEGDYQIMKETMERIPETLKISRLKCKNPNPKRRNEGWRKRRANAEEDSSHPKSRKKQKTRKGLRTRTIGFFDPFVSLVSVFQWSANYSNCLKFMITFFFLFTIFFILKISDSETN